MGWADRLACGGIPEAHFSRCCCRHDLAVRVERHGHEGSIDDVNIMFQGMVNRLTRVHIPKLCCPVTAASQNRFAVGTTGDSPDAALMTPELSQFSCRRCIPEASCFVYASRQYGFSIRTEGHGHQNALMSQRRAEGVTGADLPEPDSLIRARREIRKSRMSVLGFTLTTVRACGRAREVPPVPPINAPSLTRGGGGLVVTGLSGIP